MKGYKEILISFSVAFATILALSHITQDPKRTERVTPRSEPIPLQGRSEDPALSLSWGLKQIRAQGAWQLEKGSKDIIVAVIDTGCDVHHPDLRPNIWFNPGESGLDENGNPKSSNGIDDDGNGFADDLHGWNFVERNADVMDEHGHGTHIAGIAAKVAPRVSLMILKYYANSNSGEENLRFTIEAIRYAVRMGAKIINYSGGGILRNSEEEAVLAWAAQQGVLIVAAAGNEGLNSDFYPFYPAGYDLKNVLSVGAIDRHGELMSMSNYGKSTVDLVAPGQNIYSTLPNGMHGFMSGTSQATAFVTGVAALLMSQDARFSKPQALIEHLLTRSQYVSTLKGRIRSGSVLDAEYALRTAFEQRLMAESLQKEAESLAARPSQSRAPAQN